MRSATIWRIGYDAPLFARAGTKKVPTASGALAGVRVLDLTDERAIYGAKLLADLGADVVRVEPSAGEREGPAPRMEEPSAEEREGPAPRMKEPSAEACVGPDGDPLRQRGPFHEGASLWHAFFASNRRFVPLDVNTPEGEGALARLFAEADVALVCGEPFAAHAAAARKRHPHLVVVDVSSFGRNGPWRSFLAPDLVAGALGGAVATTGDVDTPPLKTFGELNFALSGAYAAIAALAGLRHAHEGGGGQRVDVSVHECIASCLEHVFMWYWYHERMPRASAAALPRRGSLHWSNAYCVMPAKSGAIMVTPTPNFDNQLVWLVEQEAQEDLFDPSYQEPGNRRAYIDRLMQVLRGWVSGQDVEALFFEAQGRHAPYGWVLPVDKVAENPQLHARDWWTRYPLAGGDSVRGPGAPYHFSATPWRIGASETGAGFSSRPAPPAHSSQERALSGGARGACPSHERTRPLQGVRVLDFTHVLAGPFATRILADMGADVVKVNTGTRTAGNPPNSIYYVIWNRNKRALALDMTKDESRALCKRLCQRADVVIDNFSVGVLERWGVGYQAVAAANPGVVYVQMSGMGDSGPWSKFVTYAPTVHALAGLTHLTGVPGRQDIGIGFSYNDHCAGLHGAVAILAALQARQRTGQGQRVDMSQFELGVGLSGPTLMDYFANGRVATPCGNRLPYDNAAPHGCYPCAGAKSDAVADERWVAIACMTDAHWAALKRVMGDPQWARADALASADGRLAFADLNAKVAEWTYTLPAEEVMQRCQAAGVPAGVVQTGVDLAERDPQLKASNFLFAMDEPHPVQKTTFADRLPLHFERTPCNEYRRSRQVGEDNAAVLADWLGMSAEEVHAGEQAGYLA